MNANNEMATTNGSSTDLKLYKVKMFGRGQGCIRKREDNTRVVVDYISIDTGLEFLDWECEIMVDIEYKLLKINHLGNGYHGWLHLDGIIKCCDFERKIVGVKINDCETDDGNVLLDLSEIDISEYRHWKEGDGVSVQLLRKIEDVGDLGDALDYCTPDLSFCTTDTIAFYDYEYDENSLNPAECVGDVVLDDVFVIRGSVHVGDTVLFGKNP